MDTQQQSLEFCARSKKTPGILRPITSHGTGRYETSTLVEPLPSKIPVGFDPEPEYLPQRWSAHVHPEGQLYFHRAGPLRVVTEAHLYRPETLENACFWIARIEDMLSSSKVAVPEDVELFIELEDDGCAYYLVNHATRTQFWLENSGTEELELPPVISTSQLKIVLEELYWHHLEHFPMHLKALSYQTLDELIGIFSHGLCDQMTSLVSTFLYKAQDCNAFISILQGCRGNMDNGHTTWIIARLWSTIERHKYMTHYGQERSRLSRDQAILYDPGPRYRWISTIMAAFTFETSDGHLARLDDVFVDHFIYVDRWERLMGDCLAEWRQAAYGALSGLMLQLPFLVHVSTSSTAPLPVLLAVSVAIFGCGLASSILLCHKYEPMQNATASDATSYLATIQSPVFKFQPLAFVFSLPKALHLWGFVVCLVNCVLAVVDSLGWGAGLGFSVMTLLVLSLLYCTTSEAFHTALGKFIKTFPRADDSGADMV